MTTRGHLMVSCDLEGVTVTVGSRRNAIPAIRAAIAAYLEVEPDRFDVSSAG